MDNSSMNFDMLHHFFEGYKIDLDNHAEGDKTFYKGVNGRLVSENGVLSYVSIDGTRKVYENNAIVKYLGWWAFKDELILFTKTTLEPSDQTQTCTDVLNIIVSPITVNGDDLSDNVFEGHYTETIINVCVPSVPVDENDFTTKISCVGPENDVNDYGDLFVENPIIPLQYCPILNNDIPINNEEYRDAIWSMKYNQIGTLTAELLWVGYLNLPMDAKICTFGVDENNFYKRVYFTDYTNVFRVINLKDKSLSVRRPEEFGISVNGTLLNPRIVELRNNGVLNAMSVTYMYRLITENGQVSDFSACSAMVRINKDDGDYKFSGGGPKEATDKSVLISAIVPDYLNFNEIELIAVEYEAELVPTTIRVVGRIPVAFYNEFEHFGTEAEFTGNLTLADLFANSISWKYCSDIEGKNNKLVAAGLRNDPSFVNSKEVDIDFALHGFHWQEGETHDCLLNPNPIRYNYIDVSMTESFMFVVKKIFREISVLGNFWVRLENKSTGEFYQYNVNNAGNTYNDYTLEILNFLLEIQENEGDFSTKFPNLTIAQSNGKILFLPTNTGIQTDMYAYVLNFSTSQVIMDSDVSLQMKDFSWPATDSDRNSRLVYGGVSNGWFNNNGVRVTMDLESDHVMSKNEDYHDGSGPILQLKQPTLKKGCMKGEIYRLGIQWYKNGQRLFTTVLGDLKIPDIGQQRRELDINGNVHMGNGQNTTYKNFYTDSDRLMANRIELRFDVRISCELSRQVDAYQIVYVERTEQNRSILAQGISAPLHRMLEFDGTNGNQTHFDARLTDKWNLPYYGGPIIDVEGLISTDNHPNNDNIDIDGSNYNWQNRIQTSRDLLYFDSPDLIYDRLSDTTIESAVMQYVATVRTDHDIHNIAGGYNRDTTSNDNADNMRGTEIIFPDGSGSRADVESPYGSKKFSAKIPHESLGQIDQVKPYFVNVSVFSNLLKTTLWPAFTDDFTIAKIKSPFPLTFPDIDAQFGINHASMLEQGEQAGASRFGQAFPIVNAAAVLSQQGFWYQKASRIKDSAEFSSFRVNNISLGRRTLIINTSENYYTPWTSVMTSFTVNVKRSFGTSDHNSLNDCTRGMDAHIISNIKRPNTDSIYGGRTEYAYSRNEYIPMSDVIPVIKNNVASQVFNVQGDVYSTVFIRNKNSYIEAAVPEYKTFSYRTNEAGQYSRYGAWAYAVVLETMVEPRLNHSEEFYREDDNFNFMQEESLNTAYLQENTLRKSLPKPLNFKDDPNQSSTIAVSEVKLSGDYVDAFTQFKTNEFYELDKDKGAALNIIKQDDDLFVVQELQTSLILMDERSFITPDGNGEAIQVAQGSGTSIGGHKVISFFGTSIRRALIYSDFGFNFFDERKKEWIKIKEPLLIQNNLSLNYDKFFTENPIIDTEGWYDFKFKETNIRFRTETGLNFVLSYNEAMKCFNGEVEIDHDIYPVFQQQVIAPYADSHKLGELNTGVVLSFNEEPKKDLWLGIISAPDPARTQIEKGIAVHINASFPIFKTTFETSLGQIKEILGTHHWYRIREGVHTLPSKNKMDTTDIRGEWVKVLLQIKSQNNERINIFSIVNYLRNSYK